MNKFVIACFLGYANTMRLNSYDDQMIQLPEHVISFAQAAARAGSGVRARWIELPNCQNFIKPDSGDVFDEAQWGEVIPLEWDLSNAIIATCKGPHQGVVTPAPAPPVPPPAIPTPRPPSRIYDPVWKSSVVIPNEEHQVGPLQHGHIDKDTETLGPVGDFYNAWKYVEPGTPDQPFQDALANGGQVSAVNEWDHAGPGGINYTNANLPINYNNSLPFNNTFLVQLDFQSTKSVPTWE